MSLTETFSRLSKSGEKALVLFVTAGDPTLEDLPAILDALQEGGADVIEIGVPFSDPIADGPTIQASSYRALQRGVTLKATLETLGGCNLRVPVVLMGYTNSFLRPGWQKFAKAAKSAGVSGVIVSDLVPEEAGEWRSAAEQHGLETVFLVAPTSTRERISQACAASTGFVYAVSRTGVTGAATGVQAPSSDMLSVVRSVTGNPVCLGFGISTPEQVRDACCQADGAVVGSWLVQKLADEWNGGAGRDTIVEAVRALKAATRG